MNMDHVVLMLNIGLFTPALLSGAYSTQICHPFQRKVATQSGVKLTTGRSAATRMVHC